MPKREPIVLVITGASSGIGRETALALADRGDKLVLAARDEGPLAAVATACESRGGRAIAVPTDVSDQRSVEALAQRAVQQFGRVDAWVNCAGVIAYGSVEDIPEEVYRQVIDTNFFGQLHGVRSALRCFRRQGSGTIVNVGSVWGCVTSPYVSPYIVSKFAVRALSESLQQALKLDPLSRGIHVCVILPQSVDTPIFKRAANYTGHEVKPIPPVLQPERVARAILRAIDHPRRHRRNVGLFGRAMDMFYAAAPGLFGLLAPYVMRRLGFGRHPAPATEGNVLRPLHDR